MTRRPTTRAPGANGAACAEVRRDAEGGAPSVESAGQLAVVEQVRRISDTVANLATQLSALAQNVEDLLAAAPEPSVMSDVAAPSPTAAPAAKPELLKTTDMTALFQCNARTLRRRELEGEIPAPIRQGRLKRWRRSDVDDWLAERARNQS